jgi:hypothetical protein
MVSQPRGDGVRVTRPAARLGPASSCYAPAMTEYKVSFILGVADQADPGEIAELLVAAALAEGAELRNLSVTTYVEGDDVARTDAVDITHWETGGRG